jgi:RecA-family ATPase
VASKKKSSKTPAPVAPSMDKKEYNALELYQNKIQKVPKLLDPFFQTVGLASIVGTSDSGKSTFLRQLSISIVSGMETFLDWKLETKYKTVIYVSTEDDPITISPSLKNQINYYKQNKKLKDEKDLKNLIFIFDTHDLLDRLHKHLEKQKVDLIIIDAFTDVFTKEINANTQVRTFLNPYDRLAKKYGCLIIFLHHIGKRRDKGIPSKDSIIGSQAFEAKMRVVLELRPRGANKTETDLWVLKSNFLQQTYKQRSYVLNFKDGHVFENTKLRTGKNVESKINNPDIIKKVIYLEKKGKSVRKIEETLKNTDYEISKSSVQQILKQHKS